MPADTTYYGPTPSVGTATFVAPTNRDVHTIDWTNNTGSDVNAGDIVVVGGVPMQAVRAINAGLIGALAYLNVVTAVKDGSAFAQMDKVLWNANGKVASATTGVKMGFAIKAALAGDANVIVRLAPEANAGGAGFAQDTFAVSATQLYPLGTVRDLPDGRKFRYSQAGASNITRGLMQQSSVLVSNFSDITQTGHAQVAGATAITTLCTTGSASPANYFAGGYLLVTTGTNINDKYPIVSSTLEVTDTLMDLVLGEPLRNAIAATDKVTLVANRWKSTIVTPVTTATAAVAGVPPVDVTAANFYWAQTKGPASMTVDTGDTLVVGSKGGIPATDAVAGAVGVTTATAYAFPFYGTVMTIGAAGESALINLELE